MNTIQPGYNPYPVDRSSINTPAATPSIQDTRAPEAVDEMEGTKDADNHHQSPKSVLSQNEMATLSMLFGSSKPAELNFYGHTKIQSIHKGQLLDVKG